jgi:hypothetical protein
MSNKLHNGPEDDEGRASEITAGAPSAFELDVSEYLPELDGFDMTEAQKIEMLETLWAIMRSFVELGFRTEICGQFLENLTEDPEGESGDVKSVSSTKAETPSTGSGKDGSA